MIYYKTKEEIELIRESALVVSRTLGLIAETIRPGITTLHLDKIAEDYILSQGAKPGFKGYRGYPNTLCTSVNEQVVHGIPNNRELQEGDIVSVDCGAVKNGFYGDHAYTFRIGEVDEKTAHLLKITYQSLYLGINQVKKGNRIGDVSFAVQQHAHKNGFSIVRELTGHGLGRELHEDPPVANYGKRGRGAKLKEGIVIAIEPMINMGRKEVWQKNDGWTILTRDKQPSAHFEHDVALLNGNVEVLSTFNYVEEALKKRNLYVDMN